MIAPEPCLHVVTFISPGSVANIKMGQETLKYILLYTGQVRQKGSLTESYSYILSRTNYMYRTPSRMNLGLYTVGKIYLQKETKTRRRKGDLQVEKNGGKKKECGNNDEGEI